MLLAATKVKSSELQQSSGAENITVTRSLAGGRSTKNNRNCSMLYPNHAYFLLSCEEGLPYGIFLSGGRVTTFLDFV